MSVAKALKEKIYIKDERTKDGLLGCMHRFINGPVSACKAIMIVSTLWIHGI